MQRFYINFMYKHGRYTRNVKQKRMCKTRQWVERGESPWSCRIHSNVVIGCNCPEHYKFTPASYTCTASQFSQNDELLHSLIAYTSQQKPRNKTVKSFLRKAETFDSGEIKHWNESCHPYLNTRCHRRKSLIIITLSAQSRCLPKKSQGTHTHMTELIPTTARPHCGKHIKARGNVPVNPL